MLRLSLQVIGLVTLLLAATIEPWMLMFLSRNA